jgi:glycyl-tRNA synthetase
MYIAKKKISGNEYYYLKKSIRNGDKVQSKTVAYLGKDQEVAKKKCEEYNNLEKEEKMKKVEEAFNKNTKENNNTENEKNFARFSGESFEKNFSDSFEDIVENKYEKLIELANKKSIFYPASEIYQNSPAGFFDFGPIGQAVRRKIIDFWRHELVQKENMLEIHGAQILPQAVFEGSGHLKSFADPIIQCLKCKKFERADKLISEKTNKNIPESMIIEKLDELILQNNIKCPKCNGELSKVSKFNMMVETIVGKQGECKTFLRPEACQSIFLNFLRMSKTMRLKLPQGIAQVGGVFRNEISPRQTIARSIEFCQMDCEIFFDKDNINDIENFENFEKLKDYKIRVLTLGKESIEEFTIQDLVDKNLVPGKIIAYYMAKTQQIWNKLGIPLRNIRFREVDKDERAFYSLATFDFEVLTSIGWLELIANNYRTDYDLKGHTEHSKTNLEYTYDDGKKVMPHIWEISAGVDRTLFAILDNNLKNGKEGLYFSLNPKIAPYDCSVFPLINKEEILKLSKEIDQMLHKSWIEVNFDKSGSIGRRYARSDEIGVPFAITVDLESLEKKDVTIRKRDSGDQVRVKIKDLKETIKKLINSEIEFGKAGKLVNTRVKEDKI